MTHTEGALTFFVAIVLGAAPTIANAEVAEAADENDAAAESSPGVELPELSLEQLRSRIAEAGSSDDHDGADAVVVIDHSNVRVEPSGQSHTLRRRVIKVLTEEGAAALSRMRFDYDPATMEIEVHRSRVIPAEGEPRESDASAARDLPQPGGWIFWGLRSISLPSPDRASATLSRPSSTARGFRSPISTRSRAAIASYRRCGVTSTTSCSSAKTSTPRSSGGTR